jgi:large conductance mechanosensitive channel
MWREFKAFLVSANVLALAIAVVIGAALAKVVAALVADFIMPIVAFAVPGGDWRTATWNVGTVKFLIGDFAGAVIDFLIIGFIVWRLSKAFIKTAAAAPTRTCPYCRVAIDEAASRCPHCTSDLTLIRASS